MQFQFEWERGSQQQPAQSGFSHLQCVFELHVAAHGLDNFIDLFARKPQPLQDVLCHLGANFFVTVKMDAAGLPIFRSGHRFGDVVKQHRPGQ